MGWRQCEKNAFIASKTEGNEEYSKYHTSKGIAVPCGPYTELGNKIRPRIEYLSLRHAYT